ncbi:hypothetical protein Zmor_013213 [Zophobas morio]|uniref:Uncharacterized protein n=1 Tax=Zophobas morio TaxID=2755281 RepID=A0AA38IA99_9CUCU|nr:hypothetical protein Zmor_013213 [Zophobas morio]
MTINHRNNALLNNHLISNDIKSPKLHREKETREHNQNTSLFLKKKEQTAPFTASLAPYRMFILTDDNQPSDGWNFVWRDIISEHQRGPVANSSAVLTLFRPRGNCDWGVAVS